MVRFNFSKHTMHPNTQPAQSPGKQPYQRLLLALAWVCIAAMLGFYGLRLVRVGVDLREDFWVYWQNNRFYTDVNSALHHGRHVLLEAAKG